MDDRAVAGAAEARDLQSLKDALVDMLGPHDCPEELLTDAVGTSHLQPFPLVPRILQRAIEGIYARTLFPSIVMTELEAKIHLTEVVGFGDEVVGQMAWRCLTYLDAVIRVREDQEIGEGGENPTVITDVPLFLQLYRQVFNKFWFKLRRFLTSDSRQDVVPQDAGNEGWDVAGRVPVKRNCRNHDHPLHALHYDNVYERLHASLRHYLFERDVTGEATIFQTVNMEGETIVDLFEDLRCKDPIATICRRKEQQLVCYVGLRDKYNRWLIWQVGVR